MDKITLENLIPVIGAVLVVINIFAGILGKLLWGMFMDLKKKQEEFIKNAPKTFLTTEAYDRNNPAGKISELFSSIEKHHVSITRIDATQKAEEKRVDRMEDRMWHGKVSA